MLISRLKHRVYREKTARLEPGVPKKKHIVSLERLAPAWLMFIAFRRLAFEKQNRGDKGDQ
jgi:hypothetical protein